MDRNTLLTRTAHFFFGVTLLLYLTGVRYLAAFPWPRDALAQFYVLSAYAGYLGLLGMGVWTTLVLPLVLIRVSPRVVWTFSIVLGAILIGGIQVDSLVFFDDRFHLSVLALRVLGLPTFLFATISVVIGGALCFFWMQVVSGPRASWVRGGTALALGAALLATLASSQLIHAWADVRYHVPVTSFTPYLPWYRPLTSKHLMGRWLGVVDLSRERAASAMEDLGEVQEGVLDYPKEALHCSPGSDPLNVLIIGLDAMRADYVVERVTPNITRFAQGALRFESHWSGGNGTRPGLFSLFYGIPATYWTAFYAAQQAPVLIETFQSHGYQVGVFPSNPADRLVGLERTAFRTVGDLPRTAGDAAATEGWLDWLEKRDPSRPFFGFVFYESAPGACPPEYERVSEVSVDTPGDDGRRACYETALHFADGQLGRVLEHLESKGLADRTLIMVTSDHGEEFNENGLGFRGHGSSYSRYQLHTPMLIRWPGHTPDRVTRRTSHNDVAPTLLSEVLHCSNPPSDYSSGKSMLSNDEWDWIVAASYTSHAVVEPERVTVSYGSYFEVRGADYEVLEAPLTNPEPLAAALRETGRFMRR